MFWGVETETTNQGQSREWMNPFQLYLNMFNDSWTTIINIPLHHIWRDEHPFAVPNLVTGTPLLTALLPSEVLHSGWLASETGCFAPAFATTSWLDICRYSYSNSMWFMRKITVSVSVWFQHYWGTILNDFPETMNQNFFYKPSSQFSQLMVWIEHYRKYMPQGCERLQVLWNLHGWNLKVHVKSLIWQLWSMKHWLVQFQSWGKQAKNVWFQLAFTLQPWHCGHFWPHCCFRGMALFTPANLGSRSQKHLWWLPFHSLVLLLWVKATEEEAGLLKQACCNARSLCNGYSTNNDLQCSMIYYNII